MADGSIKIKIEGDDSGLKNTLDSQTKSARSAASSLGQSYKKAGMDASAAMTKAWDEIRKAQAEGTSVMINGIQTYISETAKAADGVSKVADANSKMADSAEKAAGSTQSVAKANDKATSSAEKTASAANKIVVENDRIADQKTKLGEVFDGLKQGAESAIRPIKQVHNGLHNLREKIVTSRFGMAVPGTVVKTKAGLADIKAGIDMTAAAVGKLVSIAQAGVNYNAQIEQYKTSFEVMTGSAEKAADVVDRLRIMGAQTPFEMADLANTTQLLMQYGFTADSAIDKMSMLGDIAQGNAQAMISVATGYAQMYSAGKVNLQDIKQMINVCHAA